MTVGTTTAAENLALGKPVLQSTNGFGFDGSGAVDGDRVGNSISHTDTGDLAPYLEINLGETAAIDMIDVFTRDNCCTPNQPERDYNIQVEIRDADGTVVYSSPIFNPWDGSGGREARSGNGVVFRRRSGREPGGAVSGQQVRVRKTEAFPGSEWLHVAEVEVRGEIGDPDPARLPSTIHWTD